MKFSKYSLLLFCLVFAMHDVSAQQPFQYNQYIKNVLPLNQSASLLNNQGTLHFINRNQWVGIEGAPSTQLLSGSLPIHRFNASAGLVFVHDKIAVETTTEVSAFIAKSIRLSDKNYFGVAINAGVQSFKGSYAELSPTDPVFKDNLHETSSLAGLSLMFYNPEKFYIGISAPKFNLKKESVSHTKSSYYLTAGYLNDFGDDFKLKSAVLLSHGGKESTLANLSAILYLKEQFGFGAGYTTNREVSGLLSYVYNKQISLTYSYQTTTSYLNQTNSGTHEIGFGFRFGKNLKTQLL